ncbi:hypothetical protein CASFOL_017951 [Castilleja foliolosa]|uniref:Uncharacterized protein n=1 Tax=Castilleja foliolosa TaxID=1961234 RepID=A0ABD3D8B9_9LAMI
MRERERNKFLEIIERHGRPNIYTSFQAFANRFRYGSSIYDGEWRSRKTSAAERLAGVPIVTPLPPSGRKRRWIRERWSDLLYNLFAYDNSKAVANLSEFTVMVVAGSATQRS